MILWEAENKCIASVGRREAERIWMMHSPKRNNGEIFRRMQNFVWKYMGIYGGIQGRTAQSHKQKQGKMQLLSASCQKLAQIMLQFSHKRFYSKLTSPFRKSEMYSQTRLKHSGVFTSPSKRKWLAVKK